MPLTLALLLLTLPPLLACSAFFSGCETALFSLSRHQRLQLSRSGHFGAASVVTLLGETRGLLITLLLGNMTVNVTYFVITTLLLIRFQEHARAGALTMGVLSVLPLVTLVLLGEVLPKMVAARCAPVLARWVALPLLLVHRVIGPLRAVVQALVITPLSRLIAPHRPAAMSSSEFESLLELSQQKGVIDRDEEHLLQQVLELGHLKVRDLMRPRVDIIAFDLDQPTEGLIDLLRTRRVSRVPVYRGDLDHIQGVVFARQVLLKRPRHSQELAPLVRQVYFVPELQRADRLLIHLRKTGATLAIAVDEFGGTSGLITIKDLVEHVVGRLTDRQEPVDTPRAELVAPGLWRVSAELPIHAWIEAMGLSDEHGGLASLANVSTVGGLVMARLGRLPKVGDRVEIAGLSIEVQSMQQRRLDTLLLRVAAA